MYILPQYLSYLAALVTLQMQVLTAIKYTQLISYDIIIDIKNTRQ